MNRFILISAVWLGLFSASADAAQVGGWPLQDSSASTAIASSPIGGVGVLAGAGNTSASTVADGPGTAFTKSLDFDNVNDYITFPAITLTGELTICAWCKRDGTADMDMVVANSAGTNKIGFQNDATNLWTRGVDAGTANTTTAHGVTSTTWHHYAWVRNASNIWSAYVDGVQVSSNIYSGTQSGNSVWDRIGFTGSSNQNFDGKMCDVRIYDSNESANLAAIIAQKDLPTGVTIVQPLAHWKSDEASGNLIDAVAAQNGVETSGTIGAATGKISGARDYESADTEQFDVTSTTTLQTGDVLWATSFWVNAESFPANAVVMHKGWAAAGSTTREYVLYFPSSASIRFTLGVGTGNSDYPLTQTFTTSTWYWFYMWHDPTANTINIQVNNGPVTSAAHSTGMNSNTGNMQIGASSSQTLYFDGLIDDICFFKTTLPSDAQKALMYNWGNGLGQPWQSSSSAAPVLQRGILNMASLTRRTAWERFKSQTPISLAN